MKPSKSLPTVLIVIVNWNGKRDVLECLASLRKLAYSRDSLEVLVVDNGSSDESQHAISKDFPECSVLKNEENIGYAKAVNQGIEYGIRLRCDYIWILNNDVVVDENALARLVEVGESDETIGVLGPVVCSYDDPRIVSNAGYSIDLWTGRFKSLAIGQDVFTNSSDNEAEVDSILGCSNLIRLSVFEEVEKYREIYDIYFEETDFNLRARQHGFSVVIVKGASVLHKNASTMNQFIFRKAYLLLRNLLLFEVFNARPIQLVAFLPYYCLVHVPCFIFRGVLYYARSKLTKTALGVGRAR